MLTGQCITELNKVLQSYYIDNEEKVALLLLEPFALPSLLSLIFSLPLPLPAFSSLSALTSLTLSYAAAAVDGAVH